MKWPHTPVLLPGEFHAQRSLVGYSPWGHKESDTNEWLTHSLHFLIFYIYYWYCIQLLSIMCSVSSVQSLSHVQLFATPRTAACQASLFITNSGSLLKLHPVGDAIRPSHLLSSPSPPAFNLSQHQGLFQWVTSSHLVAKVLQFQLQHQSFQWIFRTDFL